MKSCTDVKTGDKSGRVQGIRFREVVRDVVRLEFFPKKVVFAEGQMQVPGTTMCQMLQFLDHKASGVRLHRGGAPIQFHTLDLHL